MIMYPRSLDFLLLLLLHLSLPRRYPHSYRLTHIALSCSLDSVSLEATSATLQMLCEIVGEGRERGVGESERGRVRGGEGEREDERGGGMRGEE